MADHNFPGSLSVAGSVGIGAEPLPNAQLYVLSSSDRAQILVENSGGRLLKLAIDDNEITVGSDTGTHLPLNLQTNGLSRLSISANGNVGVSTSNPSERLEVDGTVKAVAFQGDGSALTHIQVPDGSIATSKLANGAITSGKIASNSVDTTKILDNAVTTTKLSSNSVTNLKIADNSIGSTKLLDGAVSTTKIDSAAVTLEKLAPSVRDTLVKALPSGGGSLSGSLSIPNSQLSFGSQTRQMINLWGSQYGIGVQGSTTYFRSNTNFCWFKGGTHNDERDNPGGGTRLMALNEAGDLILSARTNPAGVSTGSRCRALVDLGNQLSINYGNDFSNGILLNGTTTLNGMAIFGGSIGGFTGADVDEWPKITWYRDINEKWDEGLIKHSSQRGFFKRSGFGIHIHESRDFGIWSTGWTPLLGIEGGSGNVRIKGGLSVSKIGLGTTDPKEQLSITEKAVFGGNINSPGTEPITVAGSGAGISFQDRNGAFSSRYVIYNNGAHLRFWTNNQDVAYFDQVGNLLMRGGPGKISDVREKEGIHKIENALEKVLAMQGITFQWKVDAHGGTNHRQRHLGLIAQEVEKILPEVVLNGDDGLKAINYSDLTSLLIEAIKEQNIQLTELTQRIKLLERVILV
jgi:hypothetical protein